MRFLYWNINKKNLALKIANASIENLVDVIILSEYENIDIEYLKRKLHNENLKFVEERINPKSRLLLLRKENKHLKVIKEKPYYSVYKIRTNNDFILLFGIHFPSRMQLDTNTLNMKAAKTVAEIQSDEKEYDCIKSILVGDFNMNPFNLGMISPLGFNAVMSKEIASKKSRRFLYSEEKYFYNPMWHLMGNDNNICKGTMYYSQDENSFFWHTFDQVIMRPELIENFNLSELKILNSINNESLLKEEGIPDKKISDHLPIVFELNLEG